MAGRKILLLTIVASVTLTLIHDRATLKSKGGIYQSKPKVTKSRFLKKYIRLIGHYVALLRGALQ